MKKDEIIKNANIVHNCKYTYILDDIEYRQNDKITCICPVHGEFQQILRNHLKGQGCRHCAQIANSNKNRLTEEQFFERVKKIHSNKYDLSKARYINSNTKVCIICHEKDYEGHEHGEFWIAPSHLLSGEGCKKCNCHIMSNKEFIDRCKSIIKDNNISFDECVYINNYTKVKCHCKIHGYFEKYPYQILNRHEGCPYCSQIQKNINSKKTNEEYLDGVTKIHGDKYDLSKINYKGSLEYVTPICHEKYKNGIEHGEFRILASNFIQGYGCPKCSRLFSKEEESLTDFISSIEKDTIISERSILNGYEIDTYLPKKKIGFEFDGLYWHCSDKKSINYHLDKTEKCKEKGVALYHIFEDEWLYKRDIIESKIKNILGISENKIFARKCVIKEIDSLSLKLFLEKNHLQGNVNSKYRYGLFYNNELVSIMSFGHLRKNLGSNGGDDEYELLRFCNKLNTTVVGGASRLLKHFIKEVKPKRIISYVDKRWSSGKLYDKLGFTHIHDSKPNYFYIIGKRRENRFRYRKSILVKEGYDPSKTEFQIMNERNIKRIYDCGAMVFEMRL